jgi:UDP-N-acetylmuramate dehydrogenase
MRLTKKQHQLKLDYGSISEVLEQEGVKNPSIRHVAQAVIAIRQSKLPDPKELGNSGSFFKNPIVPEAEVNRLLSRYPDLPSYPAENELKKVPAGWLIQRAGLKGFRQGDAGVHKNQALVLVNYGKATGLDIKELAQFIQQKVLKDFGITLTPEVNII